MLALYRVLSRFRHGWTVFAHDLLVIPIAWIGAFWLRFNLDDIPPQSWKAAITAMPIVMLVQIAVYWGFGLYRGIWRFASLPDLLRIIKAAAVGILLASVSLFLINRLAFIPRSVFPLYGILLVMMLGGSRFVARWIKDYSRMLQGQRVLIVGAGEAGEGLIRDLLRQQHNYRPVAIVDDKPSNRGKEIQGVRVLGNIDELPQCVAHYAIDLVIIALPSVKADVMRRVVELCKTAKVEFRTLPSLNDLTKGRVTVDALRKVELEDLLGRDPVQLDWQQISRNIQGKSILVTGGAGSIGSELARQIARLQPAELIVVDQSEYHLYELRLAMNADFPDLNFHRYLEDVTDRVAMQRIFHDHRVDMVFHAAAYKHVPMLESQIRVALRNNVLGTQVLAEEAAHAGVAKFVLISTDKAVHPTNVMGASKRIAEIFCQNFNARVATEFITVRFGNVLGSVGSVVPLFKRQIEQGGPVTVTHPEITRYFMTIPEASQLILQTTVMGKGGEIFVLDMGESILITDLAKQMIHLAGFVPDEDIEIKFTGLRPGEKLHEELFHESELLTETSHHKILQAQCRAESWDDFTIKINSMRDLCEKADEGLLAKILVEMVPEYRLSHKNREHV